ncbi:MAG: cell envelope integrity protein CreD [Granulosicoccus sp.]
MDSLTLRFVLIGLLGLLMLIPMGFVSEIVQERGDRHRDVLGDIAASWGQAQVLSGPVLVVPFTVVEIFENDVVDNDGSARTVKKTVRQHRTARFLPQELTIDTTLSDEIRERGIFRSLVYNAEVQVDAAFDQPDVDALSDAVETIHWDQAWISIGLSDTRAINQVSRFVWNHDDQTLSPGSRMEELPAGFHVPVLLAREDQTYRLSMSLSTKGSGSFQFAPFGETTNVTVSSDWPHPSFQGSALPNSHEISSSGFTASWEVPHLARNYPQAWVDDTPQQLFEFTAGVSMFETVSLYSQITRAVKYGLLFIGLTFLTLLIFELIQKRTLHAVQYALVGVALSVFFLVLLALSEHLSFAKAYTVSAVLTILMITVYTAAVLKSFARGLVIFALLCALYAILYSLLQLEDYALLMGTALLVVIIAALMIITRNLHLHSFFVSDNTIEGDG